MSYPHSDKNYYSGEKIICINVSLTPNLTTHLLEERVWKSR